MGLTSQIIFLARFLITKKTLLANLAQADRLDPKPKLLSIFVAPEKATKRIGSRTVTFVCCRVKEKGVVEIALNSISSFEQYTKEQA